MRKRICNSALLASFLILFLSILSTVPPLGVVPAHAAGAGHITGQLLDGSNHNAPLASQQITETIHAIWRLPQQMHRAPSRSIICQLTKQLAMQSIFVTRGRSM